MNLSNTKPTEAGVYHMKMTPTSKLTKVAVIENNGELVILLNAHWSKEKTRKNYVPISRLKTSLWSEKV